MHPNYEIIHLRSYRRPTATPGEWRCLKAGSASDQEDMIRETVPVATLCKAPCSPQKPSFELDFRSCGRMVGTDTSHGPGELLLSSTCLNNAMDRAQQLETIGKHLDHIWFQLPHSWPPIQHAENFWFTSHSCIFLGPALFV